jgi:prepilin-type N-terminal cleavage/methylation domain-containing protein
MNMSNKRKGMTLMEVIIAMAIFGMIAVVFITMFSTSLIWTFRAGDRGKAYTQAIGKLENDMSLAGENPDYLDLNFTDGSESVDVSIKGRFIESTDTVKQVSSEIDTFLPQMPRITINPTFRQEGDINAAVTVNGFDTHFNDSSTVRLYDSSGNNPVSGDITPTVKSLTELEFDLPLNLLNNEYIVVVTTKITGEPDEVARTKYIVEQPKFMILGETDVYVSADGMNWLKRSNSSGWINPDPTDAIFSSYARTNALSVSSDGKTYIISQNNNLLVSNYNNIWSVIAQTGFNDISWVGQYFSFYAAKNDGVYSSPDRANWIKAYPTLMPLRAIAKGIKNDEIQVIAAAGDAGTVVFYDGIGWTTYDFGPDVDFKAISIRDNGSVVALGMKAAGSVMWTASLTDFEWSETYSGDVLRDVCFSPALNRFIAVGDNGRILTSVSGDSWADLTPSVAEGANLKSVFSNSDEVVIVGDAGKIIYYSDEGGWKVVSGTGITENLLHVSGK